MQPTPPPRSSLGGVTLLLFVLTPIILCVIGAALCMGMGLIGSIGSHVVPSVSP